MFSIRRHLEVRSVFLAEMSLLGKKKRPFVGVPAPLGYVPGVGRGESSFGFLVQ